MSQQSWGVLFRPWLWLPSRWAHDLSPILLPLVSRVLKVTDKNFKAFEWRGLSFCNPMGIAGGVDKSARTLKAWSRLGAGFLEVGTITPEPQGPNPGPIMDRHISEKALWNKMGFPNPGSVAVAKRLKSMRDSLDVPLFINVGKNRWTKNEKAHEDYFQCMQRLHPYASAFVINVSSPNTKGLRDLLSEKELRHFLEKLMGPARSQFPKTPFLLKLSPDMAEETLKTALQVSAEFVDGWILTNTTKSRYPQSPFPENEGGVSGGPLKSRSRQALGIAAEYKKSYPDKLLVSVGGIDTAEEVLYRLSQGADLVQMYSVLVFEGPGFFAQLLSKLRSASR
jgi:dihydroorotate dehydrogenase